MDTLNGGNEAGLIKNYQSKKNAYTKHKKDNATVFEENKKLFRDFLAAEEKLLGYGNEDVSEKYGNVLPIIIVVKNTTNKYMRATLFGAANNFDDANFGNDPGISVASGNNLVSYKEILTNTLSTVFSCSYIRIVSTENPEQVLQPWTITSKNMEGQMVQTPIPTTASYSPLQYQPGIVDLIYPLKIDNMTTVGFTMHPKTSFLLYFFPCAIVSPINTLVNGEPVRRYKYPNIPTVYNDEGSTAHMKMAIDSCERDISEIKKGMPQKDKNTKLDWKDDINEDKKIKEHESTPQQKKEADKLIKKPSTKTSKKSNKKSK